MSKYHTSSYWRDLRQRALSLVYEQDETLNDYSQQSLTELMQELSTYQIELEIQNEELQASENKLLIASEIVTELYDFAPIGYMTINESGYIMQCNLTLARMFGLPR